MIPVAPYCHDFPFQPLAQSQVLGGSWMVLVFLGLLGSFFLTVLVYMLSQFLRLPRLEAWSKFEFFQILATAGLALFVVLWAFTMCHWDVSFLDSSRYGGASGQAIAADCAGTAGGGVVAPQAGGRPVITPYCVAQSYLNNLEKRARDLYQALIGINYIFTQVFRIVWASKPMGIGYDLEPLAGFQQIQNLFLVGISGMTVSYLTVLVQMRLLDYLLIAVPYFFIPLGLLLRCFAPTREFGGAVMGFAIASLFFYPLTLVISDLAFSKAIDEGTSGVLPVNANIYAQKEEICRASVPAGYSLMHFRKGDVLPCATTGYDMAYLLEQSPVYLKFAMSDGTTFVAAVEGDRYDQLAIYRLPRPDPRIFGYAFDQSFGTSEAGPDGKLVRRSEERMVKPADLARELSTTTATSLVSPDVERFSNALLFIWPPVLIYMVGAVLLPIINFIIYVEIARSLSKLLGAEIDLTNLTRLI